MFFPNLPTDNLYKFVALAGVVTIIVSIYLSVTNALETNNQLFDVEENVMTVEVMVNSLEREVESLRKLIDNSLKEQMGKDKKSDKKIVLRYSQTEIKHLFKDAEDSSTKLGIEIVKLKANKNRMLILQKRSETIFRFGSIFVFIGLFMACFGFYYWYKRVQEQLDSLLKKELLKYEHDKIDNTDG